MGVSKDRVAENRDKSWASAETVPRGLRCRNCGRRAWTRSGPLGLCSPSGAPALCSGRQAWVGSWDVCLSGLQGTWRLSRPGGAGPGPLDAGTARAKARWTDQELGPTHQRGGKGRRAPATGHQLAALGPELLSSLSTEGGSGAQREPTYPLSCPRQTEAALDTGASRRGPGALPGMATSRASPGRVWPKAEVPRLRAGGAEAPQTL